MMTRGIQEQKGGDGSGTDQIRAGSYLPESKADEITEIPLFTLKKFRGGGNKVEVFQSRGRVLGLVRLPQKAHEFGKIKVNQGRSRFKKYWWVESRPGCDRGKNEDDLFRPYRAWGFMWHAILGRWPRLLYFGLSALSTPSQSNPIRPFSRGALLILNLNMPLYAPDEAKRV
jgi:hypothetical protein